MSGWLDALLGSVRPADFQDAWNRSSLHCRGQKGRFDDLFSWNALNAILAQHRLEPPRLRLEQAGRSEAELAIVRYRPARRGPDIPYIDVPVLYARLREGATLVLDSVDELHEPIKLFARRLEAEFGAHVEANCYAAFGSTPGFGVHWDDHDLFVIQISGAKRWQMFAPTRQYPLYRDVDPNLSPPTDPLWERVVESGDVIYIPRGHWHGATGVGEPVLHLTFGINLPSGIDYLTWLGDAARHSEFFRADVPSRHADRRTTYDVCFLDEISAVVAEAKAQRFLDDRAATMPARPYFGLPEGGFSNSLTPGTVLAFSGATCHVEHGERAIVIKAIGRRFEVPIAAASVLKFLDLDPHAIDDLVSDSFPVEHAIAMCEQLLLAGFLHRPTGLARD
ncbi:MAG: cupin domain-containing protein [Brevundimonas sp.]|uniref:JmjC domain-containing protein n=2 Tax=Brevundimonas sp. TaxID=1871086 RepID=UPI00262E3B16|nr:cupin domain-containing protein [Brevundimonas sp.]MDI6623091.1 cupin domain-containing protein [Brevundimonas sp.]